MTQIKTLSRTRLAVMSLFFVSGALYASWGLHVPTIKEKFALSEMMLSLALFMIAAGPISVMTRIGAWVARVGSAPACTAGGLLLCSCLALLLYVPRFSLLLPLLVFFGMSAGLMDVAINAEGIALETALRKPIMSTLHGIFSIGGATGAALGGFALARGITPLHHLLIASGISATVVLLAWPVLLPHTSMQTTNQPRRSWRGLWMLGGISCIAFIAEGAMYDWTTVYMLDVLHTEYEVAGAAYAVFSAGMASGRLCGDFIRARISNAKCILISGTLAAIGMMVALIGHQSGFALAGFTLTGLGLANIVPVTFAAAARVQDTHAAEGIARVAGMGYVGFLLGPVLIGVTAHMATLPIGLSLVAVCAVFIAILGPRTLRTQTS